MRNNRFDYKMRLNSFKRYAKEQGIVLLSEDLMFIDKMLNNFTPNEFKGVLLNYIEHWHYGSDLALNVVQAQNMGRRTANLWLREYVESKNKKSP